MPAEVWCESELPEHASRPSRPGGYPGWAPSRRDRVLVPPDVDASAGDSAPELSTSLAVHDQPYTTLPREVRPAPLQQNTQPIPEAREVHDVNQEPRPPCQPTGQLQIGDRRYRAVAPDRSHVAEVAVVEGASGLTTQRSEDVVA